MVFDDLKDSVTFFQCQEYTSCMFHNPLEIFCIVVQDILIFVSNVQFIWITRKSNWYECHCDTTGNLNHLLNDGPSSKKELAAALKVNADTGSFKRSFQQLLKLNLIKKIETKPTNPKQAYCITEQGIAHLNDLRKHQ